MALKDWKKITDMGNLIQLSHKKKDEVICIELASSLTHAKTGWIVIITSYPIYKRTPDPKYFKTKSQALKFARDYMRKH